MAIFERTAASGAKFAESTKGLGQNIAKAFEKTFSGGKNAAGRAGGFIGNVADMGASAFVKGARLPVSIASGVFKRIPVIATIGTVGGIALLAKNFFTGRAEQRTQEQLAMQAMPPVQAATNSYQISPEEYAAMQAQMRGGDGQPRTDNAERIAAARQAAAAPSAATPETVAGL